MARRKVRTHPIKVGLSRGKWAKLYDSVGREALERKESDLARASRKGQSGKKGRPLPSRKVAVKGLEEARNVRRKRAMRRSKSISTLAGGPDAGPGEGGA